MLPLLASVARPAAAQKPFPRPELAAGADTNDAAAYYELGRSLVKSKPDRAAAGFYWATRLNPNHPAAVYSLGLALRMRDLNATIGELERVFIVGDARQARRAMDRADKRLHGPTKDGFTLDSLDRRAMMLDPFLHRDLDLVISTQIMKRLYGSKGAEAQAKAIERDIRLKAVALEDAGDAEGALSAYAVGAPFDVDPAYMLFARARLFRQLGNGDSAEAAIAAALLVSRKQDADSLSFRSLYYEPKALMEYAFGVLCEERDDSQCARQAYGRALQEDLAFFPAHVRLARLALQSADTVDAQSELTLALDAAPRDPYLVLVAASLVAQLGDHAQADSLLRRLATDEPYFAIPHLLLGRLGEATGKRSEAAASYRAYLVRAARGAPERAGVAARLAALDGGAP